MGVNEKLTHFWNQFLVVIHETTFPLAKERQQLQSCNVPSKGPQEVFTVLCFPLATVVFEVLERLAVFLGDSPYFS